MKKIFSLFAAFILAGGVSFAKETFAPLAPVVDNTPAVAPADKETVEKYIPVNNEGNYRIPEELPYFGTNMRPVVKQKILQGGAILERREVKLMEAKVTIMDSDEPVKIRPLKKITSSDPLLKAGDYVDFSVVEDVMHNEKLLVKKGTLVRGMVLKLDDNDYHGKPAEITIGQFEIIQEEPEKVSIKGTVQKKGNYHDKIINCSYYLIGPGVFWIRGGEVKLLPDKDEYTLFIGDTTRVEEL